MGTRSYVVVGVLLLFLASVAYAGGKMGCSGDMVAVETSVDTSRDGFSPYRPVVVLHWRWEFTCFKG